MILLGRREGVEEEVSLLSSPFQATAAARDERAPDTAETVDDEEKREPQAGACLEAPPLLGLLLLLLRCLALPPATAPGNGRKCAGRMSQTVDGSTGALHRTVPHDQAACSQVTCGVGEPFSGAQWGEGAEEKDNDEGPLGICRDGGWRRL